MAITKLNNKAVANITTLPVALGDMVLVSSATASSSASIEFSLGNYKEYQFYFVNIHPANDQVQLQINFSTDGGSNYNVTKTSTAIRAFHPESDAYTGLGYSGAGLAQSTAFQNITDGLDNDNDSNCGGYLQVFNPSSTTYVKHWISRIQMNEGGSQESMDFYTAGYANTTSALTNIKFQMGGGNIDSGKILMFGVN